VVRFRYRWQCARYWIGRWFCPIGDEELDRRQRETTNLLREEINLLKNYQIDNHRLLTAQEITLNAMRAHQIDCDEERRMMAGEIRSQKSRIDALNEDREELFRIKTSDQPIAPDLHLLAGNE
jgi:hypothetical protein